MSRTSTDPIADLLTRIRNAIAVRKTQLSVPNSRIKQTIANLLKDNNFIDDVNVEKSPTGSILKITINSPQRNARITEIARISRPGRRSYVGASKMPIVKQGRGIVIVSTSRGVLTGNQAKAQNIGGELICKVY